MWSPVAWQFWKRRKARLVLYFHFVLRYKLLSVNYRYRTCTKETTNCWYCKRFVRMYDETQCRIVDGIETLITKRRVIVALRQRAVRLIHNCNPIKKIN